ncbi:MAG: hypothetical protein IIB87_00520 [Chloroflexi bacterium]|nr:hypothetical protein [Chloroflexota bacterium]
MRSYQLRCIVWLLVALFGLLAFACGGGGERSVEGIIINVDAASLTQVETFTVRDNDNNIIVFRIAPDATQDPEEGFFPSHLREHAVAVGQVKVFYRVEDGEFLALKLEHE